MLYWGPVPLPNLPPSTGTLTHCQDLCAGHGGSWTSGAGFREAAITPADCLHRGVLKSTEVDQDGLDSVTTHFKATVK